jgi:hypothetical protein
MRVVAPLVVVFDYDGDTNNGTMIMYFLMM